MPEVTRPARRRKARPAAITRARLAEAAFAIVDAEGADALSARRLARALGCEAMSLYHHVAGMDAVLDDVIGLLLQRCVPPAPCARDVRRELQRAARRYLALAQEHPRVFALAAGRRWVSPAAVALAAALAASFQAGGLSARQAGRAARALGAYLNGAGMALAGWTLSQATVAPAAAPADTPALRKLHRQFPADEVRSDLDAGVRILIDGLLPGRSAARRPA